MRRGARRIVTGINGSNGGVRRRPPPDTGTAADDASPGGPPHGVPGDPDDTRRVAVTISVREIGHPSAETVTVRHRCDPETTWRLLRIALRSGEIQTHGHSSAALLAGLATLAGARVTEHERARTQRAPEPGAGQEGPPHP